MRPPRNPIGYEYGELCDIIGCDRSFVDRVMYGRTLGVDPDTGAGLIYRCDATEISSRFAAATLKMARSSEEDD